MAAPTVEHSRAQPLLQRIERLDGDPRGREAVTLGLVDALLDRDGETLAAALQALRDAAARTTEPEAAGWLDAAMAFAHWGLERVPSPDPIARGTRAYDFLRILDGPTQLSGAGVRRFLETDESQVSRTGRRLLESGLVTRHKAGRQVFWQLTPRGSQALADAPARSRSRDPDYWQEALRRGFDPAPDRDEVDPTRRRVIESTLRLHAEHGIQATTWPEIAEAADVPVETVEDLFPTLEDLVRGCGAHFMERLHLPPRERAPEIFVRDRSRHDRVHRLVETLFGAYERGAEGITVARRERRDVPALD